MPLIVYFCKSDVSAVQGHPRSLMLVPIESAYATSYFVRNSDLGSILFRFGDMPAFVCSWPHPYSTLILGMFPLDQIAHVGVNVSRCLKYRPYSAVKLFSKNSNLCDHGTMNMDGQTDGQTTYSRMTALCVASRGNNLAVSTNSTKPSLLVGEANYFAGIQTAVGRQTHAGHRSKVN